MRTTATIAALLAVSLALIACAGSPERPTAATPQDIEAVTLLVADLDRIAREENLDEFIAYSADVLLRETESRKTLVSRLSRRSETYLEI